MVRSKADETLVDFVGNLSYGTIDYLKNILLFENLVHCHHTATSNSLDMKAYRVIHRNTLKKR